MNEAYCMDCMDALRNMPDNAFDLAVVDPPYGDGNTIIGGARFGGWFDRYKEAEPSAQAEPGRSSTAKKS